VHRRCDFDNFLVATLDRAIALVEVDDVAVLVAEDLDFDVFGAFDVALEENGGIAESILSFRACLGQQAGELGGFFYDAHAASAATEGGFDDEWETDFMGDLESFIGIGDGFLGAGKGGDVELANNSGEGPMKVMPSRAQARAKFGFSERKP